MSDRKLNKIFPYCDSSFDAEAEGAFLKIRGYIGKGNVTIIGMLKLDRVAQANHELRQQATANAASQARLAILRAEVEAQRASFNSLQEELDNARSAAQSVVAARAKNETAKIQKFENDNRQLSDELQILRSRQDDLKFEANTLGIDLNAPPRSFWEWRLGIAAVGIAGMIGGHYAVPKIHAYIYPPVAAVEVVVSGGRWMYVAVDRVNLRMRPDANSHLISQWTSGMRVFAYANPDNKWARVSDYENGITIGYMLLKNLSINTPIRSAAPKKRGSERSAPAQPLDKRSWQSQNPYYGR